MDDIDFCLEAINGVEVRTDINDRRITELECTAVRLADHINSISSLDYRMDTLEEMLQSEPYIDSDIIVNEVLHKVIKIIEDKSNWIYSPTEDEFNSNLEGLF